MDEQWTRWIAAFLAGQQRRGNGLLLVNEHDDTCCYMIPSEWSVFPSAFEERMLELFEADGGSSIVIVVERDGRLDVATIPREALVAAAAAAGADQCFS